MNETPELKALSLVKDIAIMMYQAHEKRAIALKGTDAALRHLEQMEQSIAVQNWIGVQRMRLVMLTDSD